MRDYPLEKSLVKQSNYRAVLSGKRLEIFYYQKPYSYNSFEIEGNKKPKNGTTRSRQSLYRARSLVKRLISCNSDFFGCRSLFVTYTFAENIVDLKDANREWTNYTKRLNRFLWERGLSTARYLAVVEFQKRGAVHYHVVYFNLPFIFGIKDTFSSLWGKGFVKLNAIKQVRRIELYVSKYLQKGVIDNRLAGEKCYFSSRGLNRPIVFRCPQVELLLKQQGVKIKLGYEQVYESPQLGSTVYKEYILDNFLKKNDC